MNDSENVNDFDAIMSTNVSISLCGMIDLIVSLLPDAKPSQAIDLCCGPGHFAIMLAKYCEVDHIVGIDKSAEMLQCARKNAQRAGVADKVEFLEGDATDLRDYERDSIDLITCTNSAHHLPTIAHVSAMVREMDRVVSSDGVAALMDLTRLKAKWSLERYVQTMGREYRENRLEFLFDDFRNSMHAAWTEKELRSVISSSLRNAWRHFALRPIPINQFLLACDRSPGKRSVDWDHEGSPLLEPYRAEHRMFRGLLRRAAHRAHKKGMPPGDDMPSKRV